METIGKSVRNNNWRPTAQELKGLGYEDLGWANGMSNEDWKKTHERADDWVSGYSTMSGSTNVMFSPNKKIFYQYDCS